VPIPVVRIETIALDDYARDVLPESFALWGDGRSLDGYVADFYSVATSPYAKRRTFVSGLREDGRVVCSCKTYDREVRAGDVSLRATGIGAVFTPPPQRGRGLASLMLGALLDAERAAGRDLAFLYSDIHPVFYERLGFTAVPSRSISLRADSLDGTPCGPEILANEDWSAVRRCFEAQDRTRPWSLRRTPLVWDWMRARWNAPAGPGEQPVRLIVRRGRSVVAYVVGRRVLRKDAFVVDEVAFDGDAGREALGPLLRAAAGDLRRVAGWLPPDPIRGALPRGSVRARKGAILMWAPLSLVGRRWWTAYSDAMQNSRADTTWSADHI
jgi:GNAT superfamily N-acetyltransferase